MHACQSVMRIEAAVQRSGTQAREPTLESNEAALVVTGSEGAGFGPGNAC